MNVLAHVFPKIEHLTEQDTVLMLLASSEVANADTQTKGLLAKFFSYVDSTITASKEKILINLLEEFVYEHDLPIIVKASEGENFNLTIKVAEGRDFSGYVLTARNSENGALVSTANKAGTADSEQDIVIEDLSLAAEDFYKLHLLLEETDVDGNATGEAASHLGNAFLLVTDAIDYA